MDDGLLLVKGLHTRTHPSVLLRAPISPDKTLEVRMYGPRPVTRADWLAIKEYVDLAAEAPPSAPLSDAAKGEAP